MAKLLLLAVTLAVALSSVLCETCRNPSVTSKSFTTQDATIVTNIAYISEFSVKCGSGAVPSLYAEFNGNVVPVSHVGPNQYQVSWTEDTTTARSGDKLVRIFDEDGHSELRKALRNGNNGDSVPSLFDVVINYPGAYNGPWLKSELFATIIFVVSAYFAITLKLQESA